MKKPTGLVMLLLSAVICIAGCSGKTVGGLSEPQDGSDTAAELTTANEEIVLSTSGSTEAAADVTQPYAAAEKDIITEDDSAAVSELCHEACYRWARLYNGYEEAADLSELVTTEALNRYLVQSAKSSNIMGISSSKDAEYKIEAIEYNGRFATVRGAYADTKGSYGIFIFITENIDGKLYISDMLYDCMGSFDDMFRSDLIKAPQPDFWNDPEQYAPVLDKALAE